MHLENIPKEQVRILASILQQPPSEAWIRYAERVYCIEPQLDRSVLRPDFLHRLVQLPQSHYASLCGLHKILNAKIVHEIFVLVATEVGLRLNSIVVAGRDKIGHETWDCSILNLRSLHGAWLDPKVFWDTFGHTLDVSQNGYSDDDYMTKWAPDEHKCEACVLARIGGDIDTVFDLHMVIRSRVRTRNPRKYHEPRLMNVIEGWLQMWKLQYGTDEWKGKLEWNELRARRLKDARREIARGKSRSRRGGSRRRRPQVTAPIVPHEPRYPGHTETPSRDEDIPPRASKFEENLDAASDDDNDGAEIRDTLYEAENDLIDCYAALISTPFLPGMGREEHEKRASVLSRHSVLLPPPVTSGWPMVNRPSVTQDAVNRSATTKHRRPSNYSESVYSQPTVLPPERPYASSKPLSSSLRRSNTLQEKRISERSWVTASVAPSAADSQLTASRRDNKKYQKAERVFDAISEEPPTPRRAYDEDNNKVISPLRGYDYTLEQPSRYMVPARSGRDSPVSPVSPESDHDIADSYFQYRPRHTEQDRYAEYRGGSPGKARPDSLKAKIGPRLSKPFDGPAPIAESGAVTNTGQRFRGDSPPRRTQSHRQSSRSNTTHWSDFYGDDADRIRRVEGGFQNLDLNQRSGSKSGKKRR